MRDDAPFRAKAARVQRQLGRSPILSAPEERQGSRALCGDLEPGFRVEHFGKDRGWRGEARRLNLALPGLALAQQLYVALLAQGHGRLGTHWLILALARLPGVDWLARTTHRLP